MGAFYLGKIMANSAQIAKQLAQYDKSRKSSDKILNESMAQYGVPEIRNRVAGLRTTLTNTENALNAVDPSVTGRTSRSLVTEAQRSRIVNQEREPIAAQYGQQAGVLSNESANLTAQEQAANQLAQGRINDYQIGRTALQSQYNDAATREAKALAKAQADRAYKLQKQQADRSYKLSLRSAALAEKNASKSSRSTAATPTTSQFLASAFSGYKPAYEGGKAYYTEREIIPALMANYNLSEKAAKEMAFSYRKRVFGEGYGR